MCVTWFWMSCDGTKYEKEKEDLKGNMSFLIYLFSDGEERCLKKTLDAAEFSAIIVMVNVNCNHILIDQ